MWAGGYIGGSGIGSAGDLLVPSFHIVNNQRIGDFGVYLCSFKISMAEQFRDHLDRDPLVK